MCSRGGEQPPFPRQEVAGLHITGRFLRALSSHSSTDPSVLHLAVAHAARASSTSGMAARRPPLPRGPGLAKQRDAIQAPARRACRLTASSDAPRPFRRAARPRKLTERNRAGRRRRHHRSHAHPQPLLVDRPQAPDGVDQTCRPDHRTWALQAAC